MNRVYVLLASGFEEVEALTPVDVLRRAGIEVLLVSTTGSPYVQGSHQVVVKTDCFLDDVRVEEAAMMLLPGGLPGATNLAAQEKVKQLIRHFYEADKWLAAICAAPMILGEMLLLEGRKATCYPGFEKHLHGAQCLEEPAVCDGKIITGRGVGAAMAFSLELVRRLIDEATALELKKKMVVA